MKSIDVQMLLCFAVTMFDPKHESTVSRHIGAIDPDCNILHIAQGESVRVRHYSVCDVIQHRIVLLLEDWYLAAD